MFVAYPVKNTKYGQLFLGQNIVDIKMWQHMSRNVVMDISRRLKCSYFHFTTTYLTLLI